MKKFMLILFIASLIISGQQIEIEQLTNGDYEIKNPAFPQYAGNWPGLHYGGWGGNSSLLFFEIHNKEIFDTTSNIGYLKFNYDERKFDDEIYYLTNDNIVRQNISATSYPVYMVLWETNKNGNWDIEYTIQQDDSSWSEPKILFGSEEDEQNAKIIQMTFGYYSGINPNTLWITFEKNNSVFLAEFSDSLVSVEPVLSSTSKFSYSKPDGFLDVSWRNEGIFIAAERADAKSGLSSIVLTDKRFESGEWREPFVVSDSGNSINPQFVQLGQYYDIPYTLSFVLETGNRSSVNFLLNEDYYNDFYTSGLVELETDTNIQTSDYFAYMYFIVTKQGSNSNIETHFPFVYKAVRNDSTFIVLDDGYYSNELIYVNTGNEITTPTVGPVAPYPSAMVSYMVWTDETENGINLFGMKRHDILGTVEDEGLLNNIYLYQNFPNPFNPTTTIQFSILHSQFATLKVYDILGRKIKTLLNKPMQPGSYEVEFNGSNLTSGVYFYVLETGSKRLSKKMLLMK